MPASPKPAKVAAKSTAPKSSKAPGGAQASAPSSAANKAAASTAKKPANPEMQRDKPLAAGKPTKPVASGTVGARGAVSTVSRPKPFENGRRSSSGTSAPAKVNSGGGKQPPVKPPKSAKQGKPGPSPRSKPPQKVDNGGAASATSAATAKNGKRSLAAVANEIENLKRFLLAEDDEVEVVPLGNNGDDDDDDIRSVDDHSHKEIVFPKSPYEYDRSLEPVQTSRGFTSMIHTLVESERAAKSAEKESAFNGAVQEEPPREDDFIALPALPTKEGKGGETNDEDDHNDTDSEEANNIASSVLKSEGPASRFKGRWRLDEEVQEVKSGYVHLHNELIAYMDHVAPTQSDVREREHIVATIRSLCSEFWPESQTKVFGSCATGLCLPDSDVDICVLNAPSMAIHRLANSLRSRNLVDMLQKLDSANVPIIKFRLRQSPFEADVSFNQVGGLTTATFIHQCMEAMPEVKPLVLAVKHFLSQRDLNETYRGGMGSYLCFLTVVAVCQRARRLNPQGPENLGKLLIDYFDFYGNILNYDEVGISLLNGGSFFRKTDRRWFGSEKDRGALSLWLEDPMNTESNVGCKAYKISLVRHAFSVAHAALIGKVREYDRGVFRGSILATVIRLDPVESAASSFKGKITTFDDDANSVDSDDIIHGH